MCETDYKSFSPILTCHTRVQLVINIMLVWQLGLHFEYIYRHKVNKVLVNVQKMFALLFYKRMLDC